MNFSPAKPYNIVKCNIQSKFGGPTFETKETSRVLNSFLRDESYDILYLNDSLAMGHPRIPLKVTDWIYKCRISEKTKSFHLLARKQHNTMKVCM